jgi:hypothetical protein
MGTTNRKTVVINLFAGPGAGKSTNAADIYALMKRAGLSVELVREYAKDFVWGGKRIDRLHQITLAGEQAFRESSLYGKVDYVVTDSPVILSGYYQRRYTEDEFLTPCVKEWMGAAEQTGVVYKNIFLTRSKPYVSEGRNETEEQAKQIDDELRGYLTHKCRFEYTEMADGAPEKIVRLVTLGWSSEDAGKVKQALCDTPASSYHEARDRSF